MFVSMKQKRKQEINLNDINIEKEKSFLSREFRELLCLLPFKFISLNGIFFS